MKQSKTFTCAICKETFDYAWSDEEAAIEAIQNGIDPTTNCDVVCDDCFKLTPYGQPKS